MKALRDCMFLAAGAHGRRPVNESTRNWLALTGPAVSHDVWQTYPQELAHCTAGWERLEDMQLG